MDIGLIIAIIVGAVWFIGADLIKARRKKFNFSMQAVGEREPLPAQASSAGWMFWNWGKALVIVNVLGLVACLVSTHFIAGSGTDQASNGAGMLGAIVPLAFVLLLPVMNFLFMPKAFFDAISQGHGKIGSAVWGLCFVFWLAAPFVVNWSFFSDVS